MALVARPVVVNKERGEIAARKMLGLSLTVDHQLVDGAPAARVVQRLKHAIERPDVWLTR